MKKQVAGCVVIRLERDDSKILLVSENGQEWGIPKGGIELCEEPEAAAIRETFEETSIPVKAFGYVGTFGRLSAWWAFPLDVDQEPVPLEGEILSAGYFSIDSLPEIDARQQSLVDIAVERLKAASKI